MEPLTPQPLYRVTGFGMLDLFFYFPFLFVAVFSIPNIKPVFHGANFGPLVPCLHRHDATPISIQFGAFCLIEAGVWGAGPFSEPASLGHVLPNSSALAFSISRVSRRPLSANSSRIKSVTRKLGSVNRLFQYFNRNKSIVVGFRIFSNALIISCMSRPSGVGMGAIPSIITVI
jgi:hypothetical protein